MSKENTEQKKKLYKSRKDKMIDGVCAGWAEYFDIKTTVVRIIWTLSIFINGLGFIAYLVSMILIPPNPEHKKLKGKDKVKLSKGGLIFGIIFILLGLILLTDGLNFHHRWFHPFHLNFFGWEMIPWLTFWPLILVGIGIAYIIYVVKKEENNKGTSKQKLQKSASQNASSASEKRLYRNSDKKMIAGVCKGIAEYVNIDVTFVRIGFVVMALISNPAIFIIIYFVLLLILPEKKNV